MMDPVAKKLMEILNRRLGNSSQYVTVKLSYTIVENALEEMEQEGFRISAAPGAAIEISRVTGHAPDDANVLNA